VLSKKFDENAKKHFEQLVKQSEMNVEENRATVQEYKQEMDVLAGLKKKLSRQKGLRAFLIILAVLGVVMLAVGIYLLVQSDTLVGAILTSVGVVLTIISIIVAVKVVTPKIKRLTEECNKQDKLAGDLKEKAWEQMASLNGLFESDITKKLIESTVPLIQIDDNFNMRRYDYLSGKYGFGENDDEDRSTIALLTGEILGNPFVVDRELVKTMGTETYTGSIVIHWTTTTRDSKGNRVTQHHTQTLVATVTKPKPFYSEQTRLIYGNEAAPDLVFSHAPSHAENMSERALESKVKSGAKKIQRKQEKDLKKGVEASFTGMGNEEFDVLFGALDRNNEVQFRLLFTPLAQKNMIELMKDKDTYGDDFYFNKSKCLNFISSEHSQYWDLNTEYTRYQSYYVDDAFNKFMSFNRNYFKSLYFDLAPLLAIPLYQQHKPHEYIYKDVYPRNYTSYEAEYAVNKLGQQLFENKLSQTKAILKTAFVKKDGNTDEVKVTAHSFNTQQRVELVPKLGGDGHMHNVPVHWTEYIPVQRDSSVKLKQLNMSDKQFDQKSSDENFKSALGKHCKTYSFSRGILCCPIDKGNLPFDKDIDNVL
ncbi:MAG: hypothetical protein K2G37_01340, partial [Clostridia bacterium]|nr:hypothetical protein [Clostridia bacterium]